MDPKNLDLFNKKLTDFDFEIDISGPIHRNIFIVGAPRSGTTLISQIFASCTTLGYVNNLMAMFWNAPAFGASMSKKWIENKEFSGKSEFGGTYGLSEPHEFGAFWRRHLKMQDMRQPPIEHHLEINWTKLIEELNKITCVFNQPVVYKAFHLSWFISHFSKIYPESKWIWVTRNTVDNARSILDLRRHFYGGIDRAVSLYPKELEFYSKENGYLQSIAQVEIINNWIKLELSKINLNNWFNISLDSLVDNPEKEISSLSKWVNTSLDTNILSEVTKRIKREVFPNDSDYMQLVKSYEFFQNKIS